jgi:hypothetical protein
MDLLTSISQLAPIWTAIGQVGFAAVIAVLILRALVASQRRHDEAQTRAQERAQKALLEGQARTQERLLDVVGQNAQAMQRMASAVEQVPAALREVSHIVTELRSDCTERLTRIETRRLNANHRTEVPE